MKRADLIKIVYGSLLSVVFIFTSANLASAAVFTVTRNDDRNNASCISGDCSLREAVKAATAATTDDEINFASNLTTVTLTNEIVIVGGKGTLAIKGNGADIFTVDGGAGQNRIFFVNGATVSFTNLTLTGGNGAGATFSTNGGAMYVFGGAVMFDRVHLNGNAGGSTGGIFFVLGTYRISNSTFSGNTTTTSCGAFFLSGGSMTIINSTFYNNSAQTGGAICNSGDLILRSVTISGNTAPRGGGGIIEDNANTLDVGNSIIAGNNASSGPPEIWANTAINSRGNNIIGDSQGDAANTKYPLVYHASDILDTSPVLGGLAYNGGSTPTLALLAGSPAIDLGSNNLAVEFSLLTDQRFYRRISDGDGDGIATVDIGAYEYNSTAVATADISGRVTARNRGAARVLITLTSDTGETRTAYTNPFGYYRFKEVRTGDRYTFTLKSKQFTFAPQTATITGNSDNFNFTAQ